jgi:hypothetical protein
VASSCECGNESSCSIQNGKFLEADDLLVSHDGLCSMGLVTQLVGWLLVVS